MRVRFNGLPRPVRERFVHLAGRRTADPRILLRELPVRLGLANFVFAVLAPIPIVHWTRLVLEQRPDEEHS